MRLRVQRLGPEPHRGVLTGPSGFAVPCALGRAGITTAKMEGDGATPRGVFGLSAVLFRPDRLVAPMTVLPAHPIAPCDGWCDDPSRPEYNQPVQLPAAASHERLWRHDHFYDIVVVLGHNSAPVIAGRGSAIFFHLARSDYGPTAGCVAVARHHMLAVLAMARQGTAMRIG